MLDITLRPLKDTLCDPLANCIPLAISPTHLTILAFLSGLISCVFAATSTNSTTLILIFWALNRLLDGLDGAVARRRNAQSDLGGFLDLLGDFTIYALVPISCAIGTGSQAKDLLAVCFLEAAFFINNFILFYIAAILEKEKANGAASKELTSVMMRPALVEGTESAVLFTAMLAMPQYLGWISWGMTIAVWIGIVQRIMWMVKACGGEKRKS